MILDFSGKIVHYFNEAQLNQQTHVKINTFTWINGIYVVKCLSTDGKYSVFKLIKH